MCDTKGLKAIKKTCGQGNAPDLKTTIWVAFKEEIEEFPEIDPLTHSLVGDIVFRAASASGVTPAYDAGKFKAWEISVKNNSFSSEAQGESESRSYNDIVKAFINRQDTHKAKSLKSTIGAELIIVFKDNNKETRIVGNLDKGATLKYTSKTSPQNGYELEFMCETEPHEAPYYTGEILV